MLKDYLFHLLFRDFISPVEKPFQMTEERSRAWDRNERCVVNADTSVPPKSTQNYKKLDSHIAISPTFQIAHSCKNTS